MPDSDHQSVDPDASIDHVPSQNNIGMQTQLGINSFGGEHSIRPVTLRQVLEAKQAIRGKNEPWKLHGQPIDYITVVAAVWQENVKEGECRAWYKVIDGTSNGAVTVFRNFQRAVDRILPVDDERIPMLPRHRYVRITGRVGASSGNWPNNINADAINIVEDPHEVFYHALSVFYNELALEKGLPSKEVLQSLPDEVQGISGMGNPGDLPSTQDISFADTVFSTPARPTRQVQSPATPVSTPKDVRAPTNLSYTPTRPTRPLQTPKKPTTDPVTPPRVSPARRHAEEPAQPASPTKYVALEPDSPVAGPSTPRRARVPSPSSPPMSPSPSPEKPKDKGKGRALIAPDPLSHLTPLQRKILLFIMENQTEEEDVRIGAIGDCVFAEDPSISLDAIDDALDVLLSYKYIMYAGEPIGCVFRAVEQDDGYVGYGSIED